VQVSLPILTIVVYTALLATGYDGFGIFHGDPTLRPLPVYVALGIVLLAFQADISRNKSTGRVLYLYLTSGFAILYAGITYFFGKRGDITRNPLLYIVLDVLLLLVFLYDAINRRRSAAQARRSGAMAAAESGEMYGDLAGDFAGLAGLFGISALLLDLLGPGNFWQLFFQPLHYIRDVNGLGLADDQGRILLKFLPAPIDTLESLNVALAIGTLGIALLLLGIVGILAVVLGSSRAAGTTQERLSRDGNAVGNFLQDLAGAINPAIDRVLLSLRLVLGPLVWLIPAFSLAIFSDQLAQYLQASFADHSAPYVGLFLPISQTAQDNVGDGFVAFGLAALALSTVIIAVSVVEHDLAVIGDMFRVIGLAGRALALTYVFFTYSLSLINAFVVFVSPANNEQPFQIGIPVFLAIIAGLIYAVVSFVVDRVRTPRQPPVPVSANR
jgi:hypothetical protein